MNNKAGCGEEPAGQRPVVDDIIIGPQAREQTYNVEGGLH